MEGNNVYNFTLVIDKEDRLDKHLKNHFPEYSRATIQKWIKNDNVKIDGKTCAQKDIIKSSCNVSIDMHHYVYIKGREVTTLVAYYYPYVGGLTDFNLV